MKGSCAVLRVILTMSLALAGGRAPGAEKPFRPPAVPLAVHDPYLSIWSPADHLADATTMHWTQKAHPLRGLVRVDGKCYRVLGADPQGLPAMGQRSVRVDPTRTICEFGNNQIRLTMTFISPALCDDLEAMSRPLTYIAWDVAAVDGKKHAVELYFDCGAELAVDTADQQVTWSRERAGGLNVLRLGSKDQKELYKRGDDVRIDWGYAYLAAPADEGTKSAIVSCNAAQRAFAANGQLPASDDEKMPRAVKDDAPVLAFAINLGPVGEQEVSRYVMLAYDDLHSINYFRKVLRPYWRRNGAQAADLLQAAARDYEKLRKRCGAFDEELMADLEKAGGIEYARIGALAYRQTAGANKLVADENGALLVFMKEQSSDGLVQTVDLMFPQFPFYLLFCPAQAKAQLEPVLEYASSWRWPSPFPPRDLGRYPVVASGYGGWGLPAGHIPVEDAGDMLLMIGGIARAQGDADFARRHWHLLTRWAEYLKEQGMDPANQLCTDDFTGHLAHNANLSAKAICALGAYAMLADMIGRNEERDAYRQIAKNNANNWVRMADEGDHTRLAFDMQATWSQKYNLIWDNILGLELFPVAIKQRETAYYRKHLNHYGVPLDSRADFTKLDWSVWSACLSGDRGDFEALVSPIYAFLDETPQRVPMADWYLTNEPKQKEYCARSVVGAAFIRMLADAQLWKKWASRGAKTEENWAPAHVPFATFLAEPSDKAPAAWRFTNKKPADDWYKPEFAAQGWFQGPGGFGMDGVRRAIVRTRWRTNEFYARREFAVPDMNLREPKILVFHTGDAEVFINGIRAVDAPGASVYYDEFDLSMEVRASLKRDKNVLAIHSRHPAGNEIFLDAAIVDWREPPQH